MLRPVFGQGQVAAAPAAGAALGCAGDIGLQRADQFGHRSHAGFGQRVRQRIQQLHRDRRIVVVGGPDLNGAGPGDEELQHVVDRGDAADAHQGNPHGSSDLIDTAQRDRFDGRTAQAPQDVSQHRLSPPPVDRHAQHRIDQADGVGAAVRCARRDVGDPRDVGSQLRQNRQAAGGPHSRDQPPARIGIGAEVDSARDIRARDVQFQRRNARLPVQLGRHLHELVVGAARNADDDGSSNRAQIRQVVGDERIDAVVVQSDGIQHSTGRFHGPPRRIAGTRLLGHRFGKNSAQSAQVDQVLHLPRIPERARRNEDRVRQL